MPLHGWKTWIAALLSSVWALGAGAAEVGEHKYVGAVKCKSCHRKELIGDQYGKWLEGPHHKAYETLKSEEALKIAKEKGLAAPPSESDDCLECHMTGHGLPKAAFAKAPLKASDGIQCESCHGPGQDYRKKKIMSDRDKAVARGLWDPGNDETICTACHNDRSPTFDAAAGFDFEARKKEIEHPIPEDVKGKYLEVVKQRKEQGIDDGDDEDDDE